MSNEVDRMAISTTYFEQLIVFFFDFDLECGNNDDVDEDDDDDDDDDNRLRGLQQEPI